MQSDDNSKWICHRCIGEDYLAAEIRATGTVVACSYCSRTPEEAWTLEALSDRVMPVFNENYVLSASEPEGYEYYLHKDPESSYEWEREGDAPSEVLQTILHVEPEISDDLIEIFDRQSGFDPRDGDFDDPYGADALYVETPFDSSELEILWTSMKNDVKHRSRFFSRAVQEFLAHIFKDLHTLNGPNGPAITDLPEGEVIYRGRVAWSTDELHKLLTAPSKELSAPPSKLARAGRMNAAGVSVFYGALDKDTCLAEIRAPVGASVIVAPFRTVRPLKLVNLNTMEKVYQRRSMFDPLFQSDGERCKFLRSLSKRLSAPVLPSDEQLDYVVTQVICEYLATLQPQLDGLLYPSTQRAGESVNVVLFSHASRVQELVLPPGSTKEVRMSHLSDDDEDDEYTIVTRSPGKNCISNQNHQDENAGHFIDVGYGGWRPSVVAKRELSTATPSLALDDEAMEVVEILAVNYTKRSRSVSHFFHDETEADPNLPF